jgi:formate hydrogenlyase subunit 6/NADH:ubiquinone oxidoreductase subunit I
MIPYKGVLTIPETRPSICIGCGACQNVCPAKPKAIVVETNLEHKEAKIPNRKRKRKQGKTSEDFPF